MTSVASQLIEEVTAHAQRDSLVDAREICADGTYFPNNLHILNQLSFSKEQRYFFHVFKIFLRSAASHPCHPYQDSSRMVTPFKLIYFSTQISTLVNFTCQTFPLIVPEVY
jgi:hypothetical protein